LELSTGVGEKWYVWAIASVVELEISCGSVGINIELGEER
jgi:hypothetical protein